VAVRDPKEPNPRLPSTGKNQGFVSDLGWLPGGDPSANLRSTFVIDLGEARKRLRGGGLGEEARPKILETLELAEAWERRFRRGGVNRADLAREHGVSRARVTQVLKLRQLHPELVAWVRENPGLVSERRLRPLLEMAPAAQLRAARALGFARRRRA